MEEIIYIKDLKDFIEGLEFKKELAEANELKLQNKIDNDDLSEGQRVDCFIEQVGNSQDRVTCSIVIDKLKSGFLDKSDKMYIRSDGKYGKTCCCCPKQTCLNPTEFVKETSCHND